MSIGLGMGLGLRLNLRNTLTLKQKLALKQIIKFTQTLQHPEFPNPVKGLEGMLAGDVILKENNVAGILIGGLSEGVRNKNTTPEMLMKHKDVDILVLSKNFYLPERFYGGIDWWMPYTEKIRVKEPDIQTDKFVTYYKNDFNVNLRFGVKKDENLEPGLHIPYRDFVINMRIAEAESLITPESIEFDEDVMYAFERKIEKRVR